MAPDIARSALSVFFEYDTARIVHIKSKKVGLTNRFLQLVIIGYIIGFAIVYKKGYQEFDDVTSVVTTKVKGIGIVNGTVWDVADYVVPSQENNAFFVVTNLIITMDQQQGVCPEDPDVVGAVCTSDADCTEGMPLPTGNGVMTGVCNGTCMIYSWCPVENGSIKAPNPPVLLASKDFTVFIKNNINFPKFSVKRRNILDTHNDTTLSLCRFHPNDPVDKFCPIFVLEDIVKFAGQDYSEMASSGGVIQIGIKWDCNLDYSIDDCVPEYEFRRLDSADYKISRGFNFRYARYYKDNGTETRTLYKAYGIKYILSVTGTAGKFNMAPLMLNIGSGLGLLAVATILCDLVVLYVLKAKALYREKKYLQVEGDDAYKAMTDEDH